MVGLVVVVVDVERRTLRLWRRLVGTGLVAWVVGGRRIVYECFGLIRGLMSGRLESGEFGVGVLCPAVTHFGEHSGCC